MKKLILIAFVFVAMAGRADEGMFLPFTVKENYTDMQSLGLQLSHKQIYNAKKPSLKDAVVSLGGFCTAEIISPKGLLLTNHHCGYDAIAEASTPEHDYLTDGFWAMNYSEEIPVPGLTASIVVRIEDVTDKVLSQVHDDMDEDSRALAVRKISQQLSQEAVKGTHYQAYVRDFFGGNEYYLFIVEVFEDIRLVGAPPSAIGKFGGDTDNWMWERQTGDFSMFRIYAGPDNKPAEFAMDNQPYVPKHHFPISIKGINEGDFSMVMGYPGSTNRYLTSHGVKMAIEKDQPSRVEVRGMKLDIMKEHMDKSDEVRLQYASTYAQVSNYWKYFIGQTEQLKKNNVYDKKLAIEKEFTNWVNQDEGRKEKYGNVISDMESSFAVLEKYVNLKVYFTEAIYSLGIGRFMLRHAKLYTLVTDANPDSKMISDEVEKIKPYYDGFFAGFDFATEVHLMQRMFELYANKVSADQQPADLNEITGRTNEGFSWDTFVETASAGSVFTNRERYEAFIEKPTDEAFTGDKLFKLTHALLINFRDLVYGNDASIAQAKLDKANRLFIAALREMYPDRKFYPNANSTLRLTYGTIQKYSAHGKQYDYYTTIESMMAKEDPNNEEFIIPAKLKELYEKKDYGRYGQDGSLWINFISNNDITGGNSGSPVINGNGELIGCAFDGNWEAMSGDIAFEKDFQRTISCDIRYILFIIEKYAGATHLIDEMTIIE
ncbi:MAG: S46 family peptidase [Crocinitomicaceae bacterium]|nr:S46 family peptidase [Crocinitomicaceae bacterium]